MSSSTLALNARPTRHVSAVGCSKIILRVIPRGSEADLKLRVRAAAAPGLEAAGLCEVRPCSCAEHRARATCHVSKCHHGVLDVLDAAGGHADRRLHVSDAARVRYACAEVSAVIKALVLFVGGWRLAMFQRYSSCLRSGSYWHAEYVIRLAVLR